MNTYELTETHLKLLDKNTIDIYGEIDDNTALYVRSSLTILFSKGAPDLIVMITSDGGSADLGLQIYDMLRLYPSKKVGKVIGMARSMAAIILQACDQRQCADNACILIHNVNLGEISSDALTNPRIFKSVTKDIKQINDRLHKILSERTRKSKKEINQICKRNYDITADEALKLGLIDTII